MLLTELGLVGLARRARKVAIGRAAARLAMETGRSKLLLLAQDAPAKLRAAFTALARAYQVPALDVRSKADLGRQLGRGQVAVAAVCDQSFAKGILKRCPPESLAQRENACGAPGAKDTQGRNRR